eukprot:scaffold516_cov401-Prasinococcus_capsulatus_cf.AAC.8
MKLRPAMLSDERLKDEYVSTQEAGIQYQYELERMNVLSTSADYRNRLLVYGMSNFNKLSRDLKAMELHANRNKEARTTGSQRNTCCKNAASNHNLLGNMTGASKTSSWSRLRERENSRLNAIRELNGLQPLDANDTDEAAGEECVDSHVHFSTPERWEESRTSEVSQSKDQVLETLGYLGPNELTNLRAALNQCD